MLSLLPRILGYKLFKKIGFPRMMPMNYTVSLLFECNSKCSTCNVWKKTSDRLTAEQYKKIFKKIGHSPYWITFSGGEPFIRKDIVEVVTTIYNVSKPKIINIPSNGILSTKIVEDVKKIATHCKKSNIVINLSVDGIGEEHDKIRGVPGNYQKVMKSYAYLQELKKDCPNLSIGIHTVISNFNVYNFSNIARTLLELNPDSYITEIAEERVELDNFNTDITPSMIKYKSAIDFLIHRIKNSDFTGLQRVTMAFRLEYYTLVKEILRDEKQVIPCYSGIASCQIAPNGDVWSCCIKAESFGNIIENNYNFKKIWFSDKMKKERESINNMECHCPLANAAYTNMLMDFPTLSRVFYRCFVKWWR